MLEIWKAIEDYEDLYQVSNLGRVKSLNYKRTGKERILKPGYYTKYGHQDVNLCKDGVRTMKSIHRLVAEAFIPNPENKPCIDHIDCNPTNNCVYNIRWVSHKENSNNPLSIIHQRDSKGGQPIYCFETDTVYESTKEVERQLNVKSGNVSECCRGKRKSAGGYHFKYYETEKGEAI